MLSQAAIVSHLLRFRRLTVTAGLHRQGESDFVSLHAVLKPETRHLIRKHELAQMKPSAFLIDVSRGALVEEASLVDALLQGSIAGAGLDVYSQEPLRLTGHPTPYHY